ncbi:hypothetical protein C6372_04680 [Bacillus halotolerans]|nr:hypothetical protein C6372_04680 [Bacillus halotolerans]
MYHSRYISHYRPESSLTYSLAFFRFYLEGRQYCVENFKTIIQETEKSNSNRRMLYTDSGKGF